MSGFQWIPDLGYMLCPSFAQAAKVSDRSIISITPLTGTNPTHYTIRISKSNRRGWWINGRKYKTPGSLTRHFQRRHVNPSWTEGGLRCEICNVDFRHKNGLLNHAKTKHGTVLWKLPSWGLWPTVSVPYILVWMSCIWQGCQKGIACSFCTLLALCFEVLMHTILCCVGALWLPPGYLD